MAAATWTTTKLKREMWRALNSPWPNAMRTKLLGVPDVVGFCAFDSDGKHAIVVDSVWTDRGIGRIALHELIHAAMEPWLCKHFSRDLNEATVRGFEEHVYERLVKSPRERLRWGIRLAQRMAEEYDEGD